MLSLRPYNPFYMHTFLNTTQVRKQKIFVSALGVILFLQIAHCKTVKIHKYLPLI